MFLVEYPFFTGFMGTCCGIPFEHDGSGSGKAFWFLGGVQFHASAAHTGEQPHAEEAGWASEGPEFGSLQVKQWMDESHIAPPFRKPRNDSIRL